MHPQLEILLQIQDLKSQKRELSDMESARQVEAEEFNIDPEQAIEDLDTKIGELEADLSPQIRSRYERIKGSRGRAVVPVIHGTCYGCFVSLPTAMASEMTTNEDVRTCDNCGRFLYATG